MITFDAERHVTALDLRNQGIPIPQPIPAAAFIPKGSLEIVSEDVAAKDRRRTGPTGENKTVSGGGKYQVLKRMRVFCKIPFYFQGYYYQVDPQGNIQIVKEEDHERRKGESASSAGIDGDTYTGAETADSGQGAEADHQ